MAPPESPQHWIHTCRDGKGHEWVYTRGSDPRTTWAKSCRKCGVYKGGNTPDPDFTEGDPVPGG